MNESSVQLSCPVCGAGMQEKNVNYTVVLVCKEHGIWMKEEALQHIREASERKALRAIRKKLRALESENKTLDGINTVSLIAMLLDS